MWSVVAGMGWWLVFALSWILFLGGVLFFVFSAPVRRQTDRRYRTTTGETTRQEFEADPGTSANVGSKIVGPPPD